MSDPEQSQAAAGRSMMRELAHELRDALSPLASSADLARLRKFDPEVSRLLAEKVDRALRRALAILDGFVLAEQSERGTLTLQARTVPLQDILQRARTAVGAPERYAFAISDDETTVRADPERSIEVLEAAMQHAAAVAQAHRPVAVRTAGTPTRPELRIRGVLDPESTATEDWFAGYRGVESRMALRTARCIMRLQGGELELVGDDEQAFELVLRFAGAAAPLEAEREQPRPAARAPARSERILIVEDSPEVRRTYREALLALGYEVIEAPDAEQALSVLAETSPDVALIDIHLPRMNGYRLAQAIRARVGERMYLVMLSGMALDSVTRALAREAGFDDCLDKMAGPVALRESLQGGTHRGAAR
ncbi:MAG TPA: response regulator [Steroidobacteraceae bacterium]|nr:response regulator [Steroidobacteraceae bacterium]